MKATLEQIIEWAGGTHQALADRLGLKSGQAVTMWNGVIPESQAYKIQVISNGKFKVADMPVKYRKNRAA